MINTFGAGGQAFSFWLSSGLGGYIVTFCLQVSVVLAINLLNVFND